MKGHNKKLVVFVTTAAIVMLVGPAMAWDDGRHSERTLYGEYSFIGAGPCLIAPGGFNDKLQPSIEGVYFMNNTTWEGVYTFKPNGTGKISGLFRVVEQYSSGMAPPGQPPLPPDAGLATIGWEFTYSVAKNGRITFNYTKGSYVAQWIDGPNPGTLNEYLYLFVLKPWYGTVSPDHKSIFVTWGVPLQFQTTSDQDNNEPTGISAICNVVQTAFRCSGHCPEPVYSSGPCPP